MQQSKSVFRWASLVYQVMAGAALILGFVWFLSGWRSGVDVKLTTIHQQFGRIDTSLKSINHRIDQVYFILEKGKNCVSMGRMD